MSREQTDQPLALIAGRSGWVQATWQGETGEIVACIRLTAATLAEPLTLAELRLLEPSARRHRELPLARIVNAVNADAGMRLELVRNMSKKVPGNDPCEFFRVQAQVSGRRVRFELERPAKRRLDDGFYSDVARAYVDAVHFGLNPRKTLAVDSMTPADTVARWIGEARRRGKLSEGEPGKASGHVIEVPERDDGEEVA